MREYPDQPQDPYSQDPQEPWWVKGESPEPSPTFQPPQYGSTYGNGNGPPAFDIAALAAQDNEGEPYSSGPFGAQYGKDYDQGRTGPIPRANPRRPAPASPPPQERQERRPRQEQPPEPFDDLFRPQPGERPRTSGLRDPAEYRNSAFDGPLPWERQYGDGGGGGRGGGAAYGGQGPWDGYRQPVPEPPKRSSGVLLSLLAMAALVAAAVVVGPRLLHSQDPSVTSVNGPDVKNTTPSGRRPGVVNIDTELGFRNARAAGTGIVLTPGGVILTNNHVIAGATSIRVTDTDNGKSFTARVLGYAKSKDVALIQAEGATRLPTASFGDSTKVSPGDPVTAVGNAGGKGGQPTVVTGQVTAINTSITATDQSDGTTERLAGLLQVSAPIKPGDSGGPLLNADGQVVGINTAATVGFNMQPNASGSQQQQQVGQGYAIPSSQVMPIVQQIQAGQASDVVHIGRTGMLGVQVRANADNGGGSAIVAGTYPGTPAEASGITENSVIDTLNGATVDSPTTLSNLLLRQHPGDVVQVGWTDPAGQRHTSNIKLALGPPQ